VTAAAGVGLRLRSRSAADTGALGEALGGGLRPGDVVLLAGDLGAGKTTLVQGVARGLGVADAVTSPTFTLVRTHRCRPDPPTGVRTLLHADLYRLDRMAEVADLGIGELVEDAAVAVVEWGDVAEPILGTDALVVVLAAGATTDERSVTVDARGPWERRLPDLAARLARWVAP